MPSAPSLLSFAASGIYFIVVGACIVAAWTASRERQVPAHWRTWAMLAILFALFAWLRLINAEELLRDTLRAAMRSSGEYGARRSVQAPLAAAIVGIAGLGAIALLYRATRGLRGRRNVAWIAAVFAALAMILLMILRLTSLHIIDGLLYGPLKLNWIIDLGASLTVAGCAVAYTRIVRDRR